MFFTVHSNRGFIRVQHRHFRQPFNGRAFPLRQTAFYAHDPFQQSRLENPTSAKQLEQLGGALERNHLRHQQIGGECDDPIAILKRSGHVVGKLAAVDHFAVRTALDLRVNANLLSFELGLDDHPQLN